MYPTMKNTIWIRHTQIMAILMILFLKACSASSDVKVIEPGSLQIDEYIGLLKDKKVAIVANHTSMVGHVHLIDTLLALDINISKIFSPEHGFKGVEEAGVIIKDESVLNTSIPVVSLYGSKRKPLASDLKDIDLLVFDLQDVLNYLQAISKKGFWF